MTADLPPFQGRLLTAEAEMAPFLIDWRKQWRAPAMAVAQPETVEGVAALVGWCAGQRVAVVPQGGNTGLAGGSVPDGSGQALVLSLARMTSIRALDAANNTITVEAGCTLASVQEAAAQADRLYPLSLASEGSCTIGGTLATNAGGVAVLRYGNARDLCLGMEVVTASGAVWNGLRGLRKDNTGLDLRGLFIGSEGTLGVITAAVLKLFPRPAGMAVAMVAVDDADRALALLGHAQARLGPGLTAFELIGRYSLDLVLRHFPNAAEPMAARAPWYVLLEASHWSAASAARAELETCLEAALQQGLVNDAVLASSTAQDRALWALRDNISEAQAREGASVKHDVSVPLSRIPAFIDDASAAVTRAEPGAAIACFGHLGDGNLHFNIMLPAGAAFGPAQHRLNRAVHETVLAQGGSISAEHGLGVLRADEAARAKSPLELEMLCAVRRALDPLGIMNPGKGIGEQHRKDGGRAWN